MMMQGFQADLDRLREDHEALCARLARMKVGGEGVGLAGQEDIPRVIPEERMYEAVFDVIGTQQPPFELCRFSSRLCRRGRRGWRIIYLDGAANCFPEPLSDLP